MMLSVEDALSRVMAAVRQPLPERVGLLQALDRVLAEAIVSPRDVPPWNNSAMDGYAVRSQDTPGTLRVLETIAAGSVPSQTVGPGTCSRIMTGAPMPSGADAVVMIERTDGGHEQVEIQVQARLDEHIRPQGGDISTGQQVLQPGRVLGPGELGLISSLGFPSVLVAQRPRVAILSTGDEVVETGWPLQPGQIYSSNTITLAALVRRAGAEPVHCGIAPDEPAGLRASLQACLRSDLILTTGGVSVGDFDFVKDVFDDVGATLDFWKVAMKPGKPLAFGTISGIPCFGLPGNPVSCMVNFLQFVRPVLRKTLGDPRPHLPVVTARLTHRLPKRPGRVHMSRVVLGSDHKGGWTATPTMTQSSGVLMSMAQADALTVLPVDAGAQEAGSLIRVQVLDWRFMDQTGPDYGLPGHGPLEDHGC